MHFIQQLHTLFQKQHLKYPPLTTFVQEDELFKCTMSFNELVATGTGTKKRIAQNIASQNMIQYLSHSANANNDDEIFVQDRFDIQYFVIAVARCKETDVIQIGKGKTESDARDCALSSF